MITRRAISRRSVVLGGLLVLAPAAIRAQEPPLAQPTAIPIELATALAAAGGFGNDADPQILVGAIPEWVLARVKVPEGWRVAGSAFLNNAVVGVLQVPTGSDSLIDAFDRAQIPLGWKAPPSGPAPQGFQQVPSAQAAARAASRIFRCRENQTLSAWVARERALLTTITFRLTTVTGPSQCNPRQMMTGGSSDQVRMPLLYNPASVATSFDDSCWNRGGSFTSGTSAHYKSTMPLEALLEHYSKQLRDSGWTTTKTTATRAISRTWTRPDSTGALVSVSLEAAVPADSSCRVLELRITAPRRP